MPEAEISRQELKNLKRDAAIRQKNDEFEAKRKDDETRKRTQLQELRIESEAKAQAKVQEQLKFLEMTSQKKAQKKKRLEQLDKKREEKIERKHEAWMQKATSEILDIQEHQEEKNEERLKDLEDARTAKRDKEQAARDKKTDVKDKREELDMSRIEMESERKTARDLKGIYTADVLKTETTEELESFILNPYPVPLKQVLAGKLRPVPTVTQLLASFKDQKEDLEELVAQDIPTRALLRNQSLFAYVRDIQLKAESERIKPPEPQMADLGKSRNRSVSPKNKFRGGPGGTMRGTR